MKTEPNANEPSSGSGEEHAPDYIKVGPFEFHPVVFPVSAFLIVIFAVLGGVWALNDAAGAQNSFESAKNFMCDRFGWFFVLTTNAMLVVAIILATSRFGEIRLGGRHARPQFTRLSWFAMLFSAGMGIGLVFWSVAEPMYHFGNPAAMAPVSSPTAARSAMTTTFFHWGLHAWGIYTVVGAAIAFFAYNRGLPLTIRSTFHPLLGKHVHGTPGHVIDILAVVATLFGIATSLGLGVQQVNAGLNYILPDLIASSTAETGEGTALGLSGKWVQVMLIGVITLIATISVVSGLDKGIKILSNSNMIAAAALLLMVFILGPTVHLLDAFVQNMGAYISSLFNMSFWTEAYQPPAEDGDPSRWQNGWTIFYWAWWIAWSPFVGMFIARISYGRSIREFATCVLLVPSIVTFLWLSVFGNTALHEEMFGMGGIVDAVNESVDTALFALLAHFPLAALTSGVAVLVIIIFFVTSSDSGSLVIDTITGGGHPHPPVIQKIFWAVLEGAVAAVLLLCGGLQALQTGSVITGLPFAVVLLFMAWSLLKGLGQDHKKLVKEREREEEG
jgi:choline/glycine/proline betaine transport protein